MTAKSAARRHCPPKGAIDLWQGLFVFRANKSRGQLRNGTSLETINAYSADSGDGLFQVYADPNDGAIVIQWLVGLPGRSPPFQKERHFRGMGGGAAERLRNDEAERDRALSHLPPEARSRATGAYAIGASIWAWLIREFRNAVEGGSCEIWARVGSRLAEHQRIPAATFLAYEITDWGSGTEGSSIATLTGEPPLFAMKVVRSAKPKSPSGRRRGAPNVHNHAKIREIAKEEEASGGGVLLAEGIRVRFEKLGLAKPSRSTIDRALAHKPDD